jgi:AraC family transcriptional regulator of adaptative response/methylated-DNA-[protein]-cysteine methyltransferase
MANLSRQNQNYLKIASAISYLNERQTDQPQLKELAEYVGLSEFHLQRVFQEWAGVSPKQFLQFLTKEKAKLLLKNHSVTDAAFESGLSGSSRLHDLMVTYESVTPGEYKSGGKGIVIRYGVHPSPFGLCLIATTQRGLCKLAFFDSHDFEDEVIQKLLKEWPNADISADQDATEDVAKQLFDTREGSIRLLCKGTPFQLQVWEALLKIPEGKLLSYQQVAEQIGKPSATRAVASAIAKNNIAYLIPCHRVIRNTGEINQYRWGATRKQALIGLEHAFKVSED